MLKMSVNGKRIGIADEDLIVCAAHGNISRRRANAFLGEVRDAVREWTRFAAEAEVKDEFGAKIGERLLKGKGK